MRILENGSKAFFTLIALACIGASAMFAFEFGWSKAGLDVFKWPFALMGAGLDLTKAAMPMWATAARNSGDVGKARTCWSAFLFLTFLSLWCAWGITAIQTNERLGDKAAVQNEQAGKETTLKRLKDERGNIPAFEFATDDSIKSAETAVAAAHDGVKAVDGFIATECVKVGERCRQLREDAKTRRDDLSKAIDAKGKAIKNKALTDKAESLDKQIADAEQALARVDVKTATKDADPLAASLARSTGISEARIALFNQIMFAIAVEIGSGLLLWLMYGHGGRKPGPEAEVVEPDADKAYELTFKTIPNAEEGRERFFRTCLLPREGERVSGSALYAGYQKFCADEGIEPLNIQRFGRNPPIKKDPRGGTTWYIDVALAPAYAVHTPVLRVVGGN